MQPDQPHPLSMFIVQFFLYLITSCTSRLEFLSVVPAAVDLAISVVIKVDEVDQEFSAFRAVETGRVPAFVRTCPVSKNTNIPRLEGHLTALAYLGNCDEAIEINFLRS